MWRDSWLVFLLALLLGGCATESSSERAPSLRGDWEQEGGRKPDEVWRSPNDFLVLQAASGLAPGDRLLAISACSPTQVRELLRRLARTPVTMRSLAPRQALLWLLGEALEDEEVIYVSELSWRARRFDSLVMVRPDGYLVHALTGEPLQSMGRLELKQGEWWVGALRVNTFYFSDAGVFYPVNEALRRASWRPLAELGLGRDPLNAALDGAQEAMEEMVVALGQSILHPIRSIEDLVQLPRTVALLIEASPEYFARFGAMSREDQIREAARVSTHLMMMLGSGEAAAEGMGGWGAGAPVVTLTARGEWAVEGAVVAGGVMTAELGADLGALSVLHMASGGRTKAGGKGGKSGKGKAAPKGPGEWKKKQPTNLSDRALEYQEQVTGQSPWQVYMVDGQEFDGFDGLELKEAKGPGYESFFNKDGTPKKWYVKSGKFDELLEQARNQSKVSQRVRIPLTWYVANEHIAKFFALLFSKETDISATVVHQAAKP